MFKGEYYLSVDAIFHSVGAFADRFLGLIYQYEPTADQIIYSQILNIIPVAVVVHTVEPLTAEVVECSFPKFKRVLVDTFSDHF